MTPTVGMAVEESTARGSWIQRIMCCGVFVSRPAMYIRLPIPTSGGPTRESAPGTPGMVWHDPHPYSRVFSRPARGSPPWGIAISADGRWLYTADGIANQVSVIDPRTLRVVGTIRVGQRPWGIAVAR